VGSAAIYWKKDIPLAAAKDEAPDWRAAGNCCQPCKSASSFKMRIISRNDGVASVRIYADTSVFAKRPSAVSAKTPIAARPRMRRCSVLAGRPVALDNASAVCGPVAK
jgi:hypothetical protein